MRLFCVALLGIVILNAACDDQTEESPTETEAASPTVIQSLSPTPFSKVLAEIPLGPGAPGSVAVNPGTGRVYVTYRDIDVLSIVDSAAMDLITSVALPPGGHHSVAVNTATNKLYVTNPGDNTISVLDGATGAVLSEIELSTWPTNYDFAAITIDPAANTVYASWDSGQPLTDSEYGIAVIDGETDEVVERIKLDGIARLLALTAEERLVAWPAVIVSLFGVCPDLYFVAVVDLATASVDDCVNTSPWAVSVAADAANGRLYVASETLPGENAGTLGVLDATTLGTLATMELSERPAAVAVGPAPGRVYLITGGWPDRQPEPVAEGRLIALDDEKEAWSISFDATPVAMAVDSESGRTYVATADRTLHAVMD
jgi:YVTN family beta-propeller protein